MDRPRQTAFDYMVVALSPVLIMTLVGSLVFFLIEVFYHGQFHARLNLIMTCFVVATVLIGRISMTDGSARAFLFGAPLAFVAWLAMMRFVRIEGPLAPFSAIINPFLLAVVWWSAHRLTWDCTWVDESEDASGQGLLHTVGLEDPPEESIVEDHRHRTSADSDATRYLPPGQSNQRSNQPRRKKRRNPGVWVVYFSLAALPLFGIGQWFIPSSDLAGRRYVFWLLCVYLVSGLGLLMTTCLLGLRKYLRQRNVQMPVEITTNWLVMGAAIVLGLLACVWILPRPSPEYSVSHAVGFTSPVKLRSNPVSVGKEGVQDEKRSGSATTKTNSKQNSSQQNSAAKNRTGQGRSSQSKSGQGESGQGESGQGESGQGESGQGESGQGKSGQDKSGQGKSGQGKSGQGKSGQDKSGQDKSGQDKSGQGKSGQGKSGQGKSGQGKSEQGKSGQGKSEQGKSGQGKSGQGKSEQTESEQSQSTTNQQSNQNPEDSPDGNQQSDGNSSGRNDQDGSRQNQSQSSDRNSSSRNSSAQNSSGRETSNRNAPLNMERQNESGSRNSRNERRSDRDQQSSSQRGTSSSSSSTDLLGGVLRAGAGLLKLLYYGLFAGILLFVLWKFRKEIREAISSLIADLKAWWARLMGRKPAPAEVEVPVNSAPEPPPRRFADFANPFQSGLAGRMSTEELVRYSFEALEAWGRERGCQRMPEQTPLEFAQMIGGRVKVMSGHARNLAELYSRIAYAPGSLPPSSVEYLRKIWGQLSVA